MSSKPTKETKSQQQVDAFQTQPISVAMLQEKIPAIIHSALSREDAKDGHRDRVILRDTVRAEVRHAFAAINSQPIKSFDDVKHRVEDMVIQRIMDHQLGTELPYAMHIDEATAQKYARDKINALDVNHDGSITLQEASSSKAIPKSDGKTLIPGEIRNLIQTAHCEPQQLFGLVPLPIELTGPKKCTVAKQ